MDSSDSAYSDISEIEDISDVSDIDDLDEVDNVPLVVRRYLRDAENPFEFYDEVEFKRRYRFTKESVRFGILPEISEGLVRRSNRGLPIAPEFQLLLCLRYYATASFQLLLGDSMKLSQPTVSRIIFRVSCLLASLITRYIKVLTDPERRRENHHLFNVLGRGGGAIGLPGVDGAIDCTHIRLVSTKLQNIDEVFRNRKGYFSLNVQAIVGPRMEFLDIVPEWPGSAHDSRIFQNSAIHMRYLEGRIDGIIVGDAGYPTLPFLMTPIRNPITEEEITYNAIQIRTRQIVERTFGVWKRRFPCLSKGLTTKLVGSTTAVVACAVLHNMALIFNDVLPDDDDLAEEEEIPEPNVYILHNVDGFAAREALIARLFN